MINKANLQIQYQSLGAPTQSFLHRRRFFQQKSPYFIPSPVAIYSISVHVETTLVNRFSIRLFLCVQMARLKHHVFVSMGT